MNPLDMKGEDFLAFYFTLMLIASGIAAAIRWHLQFRNQSADPSKPLSVEEATFLKYGPDFTARSVVMTMIHDGSLEIDSGNKQVTRSAIEPAPTGLMASMAYRSVPDGAYRPTESLLEAMAPELSRLEDRLVRSGYLVEKEWLNQTTFLLGMLAVSPLLIGIPKIMVGIERERPVNYLIMLRVLTAALGIWQVCWRTRLTGAGKQALDEAIRTHANASNHSASWANTNSDIFGWSMCVMGPALFLNTDYGMYHGFMDPSYEARRYDSSSISGGGCSSGDSGGGSGCSSGCGGCGGGGD